jgi:Domain of unknown function (DUF4760)
VIDWGSVPQWGTACIAAGALAVAYHSIQNQKEIARKRAAMDFFAKTEMDRNTLEAHKDFTGATKKLKASLVEGKMGPSFENSKEYWDIRDYLNLHELMSVGLMQEVFDDHVCFFFWSGELERAYRDTRPLIEYVQALPDQKGTYVELVKVAQRWAGRKKRAQQ